MEKPFVSVIIPNYNHARYLEERIQSVLNQTYQNFEIIILDDCSIDNSKEVIEKYRLMPQVTKIVYNETNSGSTFKQWHKGIELAKGELIWIAESDDSCDNNLVEKLVDHFLKYPTTSMAFSTSTIIDTDSTVVKKPLYRPSQHLSGRKFIQKFMVKGNSVQNASSCLFKKECVLSISNEYMEFKGAGDRLFWIKIAEQGDVSIINEGLNYFRRHETVSTPKYYANGSNFYEDKKIFDYLNDKGLVSFWEGCLAKWFVYKKIKKTHFDSNVIEQHVESIWDINSVEVFWGWIYYEYRYLLRGVTYALGIIKVPRM